MKAKIIKTGEVVEVHKTTTGWASDNLNLTRFFKESDLDFDYCEWEDFRREAAKAAMQGILASGHDGWSLTLAEGYKPGEMHSYPIGIVRFAIACANELIKQLKEEKI